MDLILGFLGGYFVLRMVPATKNWSLFARTMFWMCTTFQNVGSFPLAVMQSLCNDLFHSDSHCFQDSSLVEEKFPEENFRVNREMRNEILV